MNDDKENKMDKLPAIFSGGPLYFPAGSTAETYKFVLDTDQIAIMLYELRRYKPDCPTLARKILSKKIDQIEQAIKEQEDQAEIRSGESSMEMLAPRVVSRGNHAAIAREISEYIKAELASYDARSAVSPTRPVGNNGNNVVCIFTGQPVSHDPSNNVICIKTGRPLNPQPQP